jgi:hypothetical protein
MDLKWFLITGLWVLRRMSPKVWQHNSLEILHRDLWLPKSLRNYRRKSMNYSDFFNFYLFILCLEKVWKNDYCLIGFHFDILDILRTRWPVTKHSNPRSNSHNWSEARSSARRSHVWSPMVGSWRYSRMGGQSKRCRVRTYFSFSLSLGVPRSTYCSFIGFYVQTIGITDQLKLFFSGTFLVQTWLPSLIRQTILKWFVEHIKYGCLFILN